MKCTICRNGETEPGETTITVERGAATLVVKAVPAEICMNCGEEYVADTTAQQIESFVSTAAQAGVQVDIRRFKAA